MMMIIIILLLLFESGLASFSSPEPLGLICNEHLVSRPRDQETTGSGDENGLASNCWNTCEINLTLSSIETNVNACLQLSCSNKWFVRSFTLYVSFCMQASSKKIDETKTQ